MEHKISLVLSHITTTKMIDTKISYSSLQNKTKLTKVESEQVRKAKKRTKSNSQKAAKLFVKNKNDPKLVNISGENLALFWLIKY